MAALAAFLGTALGRRIALAAVVALVLGLIAAELRHSGAQSVRKADEKALETRKAQVAKIDASTASLATTAGSEAGKSQVQIIYRTRTLIQRVHDAIPPASDVLLSPEWVRGYNASLGLLPDDAGASSGAAPGPGVRSADAFDAVATNNGACVIERDRADRLVRLWDATRAKVNGK